MTDQPPESLYDLSPSAKLVYKVLAEEGQLTQSQLASHTLLAPRTVRYALNKLKETGIVEEAVNFKDARKRLYSLTTECRGVAATSR